MTQRARVRGWSGELFLVGVLGTLVACSNPGGEGCGGIEDVVSCVSVSTIQPASSSGDSSSNVDAFQNPDCTPDTPELDPESFTDHNADITFANEPFDESESQAVIIRSVTISYSLNNCPTGATCPPLPEATQDVSLVVQPDSTATGTFPFVPLRVKAAYVDQGGSVFPPPSYNANYTFVVQTQGFVDTFTVGASAGFTIGDFNLCE